VAGRSPWSVCVFDPGTGTLFRSEFWNNILIIFSLIISFTSWWLKGTIPLTNPELSLGDEKNDKKGTRSYTRSPVFSS